MRGIRFGSFGAFALLLVAPVGERGDRGATSTDDYATLAKCH